MKIYTNTEEYENDLKYWSNECGDLFNPYGNPAEGEDADWLTEEELPNDLKRVYSELWEEALGGSHCHLAEYQGRHGIVLINEYFEHNDEKTTLSPYNFKHAKKVAKKLEDMGNPDKIPYKVFIGKQLGFPFSGNDMATELVVFFDADVSREVFINVADWLEENAYNGH